MNNEQIILKNRVFLMEEGVIGKTDGTLLFEDENGVRRVDMPEEIHTFNEWKKMGFIVKKGEHSVAKFPIWQKSNKKRKEGENDDNNAENNDKSGYYYMKVAFFFTKSQVNAI